MLGKLVIPEIRELLEAGDDATMREVVNRWLPADLGEVASELGPEEQVRVFRVLSPGLAAETFEYLDLETQLAVLGSVSDEESATILNEMAPDDRTALLAELTPEQAERLISLLDPEQREVARKLLTYGEDSVGRLMTPDYVAVRREAHNCSLCETIARRAPAVRLGQPFAVIGTNPTYSEIRFPPAHPHCNCTVIQVTDSDEPPKWAETLHQPTPEPEDYPDGGAGPEAASPAQAQAQAQAQAPPSIADRIRAYADGDGRLAKLARIKARIDDAAAGVAEARQAFHDLVAAQKLEPMLAPIYLARCNELQGELADARRVLERARTSGRLKAIQILKAPAAARMPVTAPRPRGGPFANLTGTARKSAGEALRFVQGLLHSHGDEDLEVDAGIIPAGAEQRAHATRSMIWLRADERTDVAVHELGHLIEFQHAAAAAGAFLAHRVGDEPPRLMTDVGPGRGYAAGELGRKDRFDRAFDEVEAYYVGKQYSHSATEVISMGLQKLYNDPVGFADADPEYVAFLLGVLDGTLR